MSDYRIFETDEFVHQLAGITPSHRGVIAKKLKNLVYPQLRAAPYFGPQIRKLRGYDPETWRYRVGSYRIFYCVDEKKRIVFLLTIDDRKDAYR